MPSRGRGLKEDTDVLRQEHGLVQHDLAASDLPRTVYLPQNILPRTNVEVLFGLRPAAVHQTLV